MKSNKGFFVTLEGIEGSGKSTLASALKEHFESIGIEVVVTAEPGGDSVGKCLRKLLLNKENHITERAELLLFEAARAQHVDTIIKPALERGAVVICDRYCDSTIAYQGYARGIDLKKIDILNKYAINGCEPDLTILLDLPVEKGLARQIGIDRMSDQKLAFHKSVKAGFLKIAESQKDRFVVIDAEMELDEVIKKAIETIKM